MIPMNAFIREPEALIQNEIYAVARVIRSGRWILGQEVQAFEEEWSAYSGAHCTVGVGNGMEALEIGIRALGIGNNDEVITTPMTAFATVLAILRAGARPVFADIEPDTALLSVDSAARCIGPRVKAILVVHLYGQAAPVKQFLSLCQAHNLHFIEDCAQAHGAQSEGQRVGTLGAFAGWSFYPTKNLGAVGDAGALCTQDKELAASALKMRNYGQSVRYLHPIEGLNSRLDELQAAILRERLPYLSLWNKRRREIAGIYSKEIANPLVRILPLPSDPAQHVHHLFVVRTGKRDTLINYLKEHSIETLIHYPVPAHRQEPCKDMSKDPTGVLVSETHAQECLSIPCNPFLTNDEIGYIVDTINKFQG